MHNTIDIDLALIGFQNSRGLKLGPLRARKSLKHDLGGVVLPRRSRAWDFFESAFARLTNIKHLNVSNCSPAAVESVLRSLVGTPALPRYTRLVISDEIFEHFTTLEALDMSTCRQTSITDQAFAHISNLRSLRMSRCSQSTITDGAFLHFPVLQTLDISRCRQTTITDSAFTHLSAFKTSAYRGAASRRSRTRLSRTCRVCKR